MTAAGEVAEEAEVAEQEQEQEEEQPVVVFLSCQGEGFREMQEGEKLGRMGRRKMLLEWDPSQWLDRTQELTRYCPWPAGPAEQSTQGVDILVKQLKKARRRVRREEWRRRRSLPPLLLRPLPGLPPLKGGHRRATTSRGITRRSP